MILSLVVSSLILLPVDSAAADFGSRNVEVAANIVTERINSRGAKTNAIRTGARHSVLTKPLVRAASKQIAPAQTALGSEFRIAADDHVLGNADAEVSIITYADFECPYCGVFHETLMELRKRNGGSDFNVVLRQYPLTVIHDRAYMLASATECAAQSGGEGMFWLIVGRIFASDDPTTSFVIREARTLDINLSRFRRCVSNDGAAEKIESDISLGNKSGVTGTPWTAVVNRRTGRFETLSGAVPLETLREVFDRVAE